MESWLEEKEDLLAIDQYCASNLGDLTYLKTLPVAELSRKNLEGWTPLMYASFRGFENVLKYLLSLGISTRDRDVCDRTCLMLAVRSGSLNAVKLLCVDERIDETDNKGWTALFHAVYLGREISARFLISRGSDTSARDLKGETPEGLATKIGMESLIEACRRKRAMNEKQPSNARLSEEKKMRTHLSPLQIQTPELLKRTTKSLLSKKNSYYPNKIASSKENLSPLPVGSNGQTISPLYYLPSAILSPQTPTNGFQSTFSVRSPANCCSPNDIKPNLFQFPVNSASPKKVNEEDNKCNTVEVFLTELKLEKYWPIFRDEEVDFETLLTFEERNFRDIGVSSYGPRHKILLALKEYNSTNGGPPKLLKNFKK